MPRKYEMDERHISEVHPPKPEPKRKTYTPDVLARIKTVEKLREELKRGLEK